MKDDVVTLGLLARALAAVTEITEMKVVGVTHDDRLVYRAVQTAGTPRPFGGYVLLNTAGDEALTPEDDQFVIIGDMLYRPFTTLRGLGLMVLQPLEELEVQPQATEVEDDEGQWSFRLNVPLGGGLPADNIVRVWVDSDQEATDFVEDDNLYNVTGLDGVVRQMVVAAGGEGAELGDSDIYVATFRLATGEEVAAAAAAKD